MELTKVYSMHCVFGTSMFDGTPCLLVEGSGVLREMGSDSPLGKVEYEDRLVCWPETLNPHAPVFKRTVEALPLLLFSSI